jgi:hypothetical protein
MACINVMYFWLSVIVILLRISESRVYHDGLSVWSYAKRNRRDSKTPVV